MLHRVRDGGRARGSRVDALRDGDSWPLTVALYENPGGRASDCDEDVMSASDLTPAVTEVPLEFRLVEQLAPDTATSGVDYQPADVAGDRPRDKQAGWVRVVVSGEVYGPLAALWPDRLDRVFSADANTVNAETRERSRLGN